MEKYTFKQAEYEAVKMRKVIEKGQAENYKKAELLIYREKIYAVIARLKKKYNYHPKDRFHKFYFDRYLERRARILVDLFGHLNNVKGKRIIDLGCGSITRKEDKDLLLQNKDISYTRVPFDVQMQFGLKKDEEEKRKYEPWFCRFLLELGANPVGVDIGNLEGEKFEHYRKDLSVPDALNFLPDKSFDAVHMSGLLDSPNLEYMRPKPNVEVMQNEIERQISRLLKDNKNRIIPK